MTSGGTGLDGVSIEVYLEKKQSAGGTPFAVAESRGGGRFEIALPPGAYYLWAKAKPPAFGPPKITECPANPVTVAAGAVTSLAPFEVREAGRDASPTAPKETGLKGRVAAGGKPVEGASVMVYDASAKRLTGPGYVALVVTGEDGSFQADLPPGAYRIAARKRRDGGSAGFLKPGDLSGEHPGNPVTVRKGAYADLGQLVLHDVDRERLAALEKRRREGSGPTRVTGRVEGPEGKGLAGQYVFVYANEGMIGRPALMAVTAEDGGFTFDLPAGGRYWLGARSAMGGPRQPGEMVGRLAGSPDSSVSVEEGRARGGLVIRMETAW